jgi:hypothetical protein
MIIHELHKTAAVLLERQTADRLPQHAVFDVAAGLQNGPCGTAELRMCAHCVLTMRSDPPGHMRHVCTLCFDNAHAVLSPIYMPQCAVPKPLVQRRTREGGWEVYPRNVLAYAFPALPVSVLNTDITCY